MDREKSITVTEAGRLGGLRTLERHGREHFVSAGSQGQRVTSHRYTTEDRRRWGALGGRPRRLHFVSKHRELAPSYNPLLYTTTYRPDHLVLRKDCCRSTDELDNLKGHEPNILSSGSKDIDGK